jgi:proteic killer suppression protein
MTGTLGRHDGNSTTFLCSTLFAETKISLSLSRFKKRFMVIKFEKEYLSELYETGRTTDKKYRFQPDVAKRYQARIDTLEGAANVKDLFAINSLHYEVLKGDKKDISSIRVNNKYRIEFKTTQVVSETVVTICNILELSNHYK